MVAYHRVTDDFEGHALTAMPSMLVSTRMLERHLDWLGRRYRVVPLDEIGARLAAGLPVGDRASLTFDDGYRDLYEHAYPLLRRKGMPAAVFVVTDLVGTNRPPLHDRMYRLVVRGLEGRGSLRGLFDLPALRGTRAERLGSAAARADPLAITRALLGGLSRVEAEGAAARLEADLGPPGEELNGMRPLSWEMLAEMQRGGITVGSHTRNHALLTEEGTARVREEVQGSRATIERRLGADCAHFAYPDGRWNAAVVGAVRAAGYRFAYTNCTHGHAPEPLLTIPRTALWERAVVDGFGRFSPAVMSGHASGLFGLVGRCGLDHGPGAPAA